MTTTETPNDALSTAPVLPGHPTESRFMSKVRNRPLRADSVSLAEDPNDSDKLNELRLERLAAEHRLANKLNDGEDIDEANEAAAKARADLKAFEESIVTIDIHFSAIGNPRITQLMFESPPEAVELKAHRQMSGDPKAMLRYSPTNFPPKLIAESCTKIVWAGEEMPPPTYEEAVEMWNSPQFKPDQDAIIATAESVNATPSVVGELGNG